jgi:hypothetical protein
MQMTIPPRDRRTPIHAVSLTKMALLPERRAETLRGQSEARELRL